MSFIFGNWEIVLGILGVLAAPMAWVFGGRAQKDRDLKKSDVEIKTAEINYAQEATDFYKTLMAEKQTIIDELRADRIELKEINKRQDEDISKLRNDFREMDKKFHDLYIAYAKEIESSTFWKDKFSVLEKEHEDLKKDHEKLREEFEKLKKANKQSNEIK